MINSKITKASNQQTSEERLFKLLEGIDWKLWEMYQMMKKELDKDGATKPGATKAVKTVKSAAVKEEE